MMNGDTCWRKKKVVMKLWLLNFKVESCTRGDEGAEALPFNSLGNQK